MKKFIIIFLFASTQFAFAEFYAKRLSPPYTVWNTYQVLKYEAKFELYGLFYETTLNLKIKLGNEYRWTGYSYYCQVPPSGSYEFVWNFSLPKNSFIKKFSVWDNSKQSFTDAAIIDISTAELNYNQNASPKALLREYMRRDYYGNYNQQYDMRFSPVQWNEAVEFIIKFITPCEINYNKRIIENLVAQFYSNYNNECLVNASAKLFVVDYNNPSAKPLNFLSAPINWIKQGNFWVKDTSYVSPFKIYFPEESNTGKFLRTHFDDYTFYQLSTKPFISDELRKSRKIVIAFDIVGNYFGSMGRNNFLDMLYEVLLISTTQKDSLIFIISDFNTSWLSKDFEGRTESLIKEKLNTVKQVIPKLNTLPYMLKEITRFLNEKNVDAEVWLISDDYQTAVRAETVMELLNESYFRAKNNIVFNILDASNAYSGYYIQNKYYRGNEYLYENLTRLSKGNFNKLYNVYYGYYIDEALDCFAPKISTVEIDPMPVNGFTHSRVNLNRGKSNFNITARFGQIGVCDGTLPITVNYFGKYLGEDYFNSILLNEDESSVPDNMIQNISLYWYGNYIINELFLQPQSYTTIKYIEELSVKKELLTPYSAFVIPGPSNYIGFSRIYAKDSVVNVEISDSINEKILPKELNISCYPNPFNPSTNITIKLPYEFMNKNKKLEIYDILGQKIKSYDLSNYSYSSEINIIWDGLNDANTEVSSGTYIAVFKTDKLIKSIKLLLVR